jgi:hypothetical protein
MGALELERENSELRTRLARLERVTGVNAGDDQQVAHASAVGENATAQASADDQSSSAEASSDD